MSGRRSLMTGGLAMAALMPLARGAGAQTAHPMVLFLGDAASEECKIWRTRWEPLFVASQAYKKLDYKVVYPATNALLLKPESWPADLRWVLDAFLLSQVGVQAGNVTPRFFLVQNKQITFSTTGNSGWRETMWPTIQDVTGTTN